MAERDFRSAIFVPIMLDMLISNERELHVVFVSGKQHIRRGKSRLGRYGGRVFDFLSNKLVSNNV